MGWTYADDAALYDVAERIALSGHAQLRAALMRRQETQSGDY
ncbi:hypothetical protein HNR06_002004 [Nocardiopsis arvandica]|uniref:Uncharacterized protein n=1 Tax=Nocardiopsis sinuspersici TaxID=501010 RepID=A0A7Y9XDM8_9ACTN|nr:hypothetical protein [Nocardiopsis sinuspersici]